MQPTMNVPEKMPEREVIHDENEGGGEPKLLLNGLALHEELPRTPEEERAEKRFVLKIDLIILPLLIIMFFLAQLDRVDVANAYTAVLQKEFKMDAGQLSNDISLFYVGYIIFELPATLFLKSITANIQLGVAFMTWGTFTALISITHTWQQIGGLRILIGCGEAFIQAASLYLTFFYKRDQLATRGGIYCAMITVAGSANGLLAYAFLRNLNGVHRWLAWRWIFLVEGVMSIGFGFIVLLLLPASPEKLWWFFTAEEKQIALQRYREAFNIERTKVSPRQILSTFKDPKAWFYTAIYMATNVSLAAFSNFLPVMLLTFGHSALDTNLMTIPVWVCAGIFIVVTGVISDRLQKRDILLLISFAVASTGWIILLASKAQWMEFVGTLFIGSGTLPQAVLCQAWLNSNMIGYTKRATTLALILMLGQCMSIASAQVFADAPMYNRSNGFSLGAMVVGFVVTSIFMIYLGRLNRDKLARQKSEEAALMRGKNIEEIQDAHPDFFYYL